MKLIVAGSRDIPGIEWHSNSPIAHEDRLALTVSLFKDEISHFPNVTEIVSGTARGADRLGEIAAHELGIPVKQMSADWDRYGKKRAGPIRNEQMARYADACLCFWDGKSRGTRDMIKRAFAHKLEFKVVYV